MDPAAKSEPSSMPTTAAPSRLGLTMVFFMKRRLATVVRAPVFGLSSSFTGVLLEPGSLKKLFLNCGVFARTSCSVAS